MAAFLIRHAAPADIEDSSALLREAGAYMRTVTDLAWRDEDLGPGFVAPLVAANEWIVAQANGCLVGVMSFQPRDLAFWPDRDDGRAFYLHKIAVRRTHAGAGVVEALIAWAAQETRALGRHALRLDCAPRPKLCAVYEGLGFLRLDETDVLWSALGDSRPGALHVVRFERAVDHEG
jgi:predicted N-acetyltransferase YhbS